MSPGPAGALRAAPRSAPDPWSLLEPSAAYRSQHAALGQALASVAVGGEVLVAISNQALAGEGGMLELWHACVRRAGIHNALLVALDDATALKAVSLGLAHVRQDVAVPATQQGVGSNHAVSGLKFRILSPMLRLGYSVLLSDVDVVFLEDPFEGKRLYRDADVEAMSDGWDDRSAYGWDDVLDDPQMGWGRWAHTMRLLVFNSGLFYARATGAAVAVVDEVTQRLEREKAWDQAVFNEVLHLPSRPGREAPGARRRAMAVEAFCNSKYVFAVARKGSGGLQGAPRPVLVHVNYHPDKLERMRAVVAYYWDGEAGALDGFPDGSE